MSIIFVRFKKTTVVKNETSELKSREDTLTADLYIVGAWGRGRVHAHSPDNEEQTDGARSGLSKQLNLENKRFVDSTRLIRVKRKREESRGR